jgi:uncharacterized membrane protein
LPAHVRAMQKRVSGMNGDTAEGAADITLVARRNNSLSSGSRRLVLGSLAAVILAISLGFALNGAWPILPFAGLELLVLGLAFRYMEQHAADYERMTMHDDQVVIERGERGSVSRYEFNRHWAHLIISEPRGMKRGRLALRSHGKEVEFGKFLTDKQLAATARRLKKHLNVR